MVRRAADTRPGPANAEAVVDEIKNVPGMESYVAFSLSYYLSMMTPTHVPGLSQFIDVVIVICRYSLGCIIHPRIALVQR